MPQSPRWDIFCKVVDNYGDIGVCWRLARQLAAERSLGVRLWVDDLPALKAIWPAARLDDEQLLAGVEVRRWHLDFDSLSTTDLAADLAADVVVEAFACHLPSSYVASMALRRDQGKPPQWYNLEYLSAEAWVEGCHGLFSIDPKTGLHKAFFFPGFTPRTGGLIRENNLFASRNAFLADPGNSAQWLAQRGVERQPDGLTISLFAYANPAIDTLLRTWQASQLPIDCLVFEGGLLDHINTTLATALKAGDQVQLGALRLFVLPFLRQDEYDRLLWSCDINFVRGEDSFVRAQWAGKPLVWQIYPQEDAVHLKKLDAWLEQTAEVSGSALSAASLIRAWNNQTDCSTQWQQAINEQKHWQQQAVQWAEHLNSFEDLVSQLVYFGQKSL